MSTHFISSDWGTTNLRLHLVDQTTMAVVASLSSGDGIKQTYAGWLKNQDVPRVIFYRQLLKDKTGELLSRMDNKYQPTVLVMSGMVSSSLGIVELPYGRLPFDLQGSGLRVEIIQPSDELPLTMMVMSGIEKPGDVMRGEETQVMGLHHLVQDLPAEYIAIFPGTHAKHIHVSGGQINDFRTYMTGELFDLISTHSVLTASLDVSVNWHQDNLSWLYKGLDTAKNIPLTQALFQIRARHLQKEMTSQEATQFLSGLLIGQEFLTPGNLPVILCCPPHLHIPYEAVLKRLSPDQPFITLSEEQYGQLVPTAHAYLLRRLKLNE